MELIITSPQEGGFIKEIKWNNQELKAEITAKMQEYKSLVFTEDNIKDAKKDRASLNKLKTAFEDERKRIKKLCMEPYDLFETQVKEVVAIIDEPIGIIDAQIKEVEEKKKVEKKQEIEELFQSIGFQNFISFEHIYDEKWLNASVSISKLEELMKSRMYQIGEEVATINKLPEFSFEAMETYKKTLDLTKSIQEGQRLAEIQKRKVAHEAEQLRLKQEAEQAATDAKAIAQVNKEQNQDAPASNQVKEAEVQTMNAPVEPPQTVTIDFRVTATATQFTGLKVFMNNHHIQYGPVPKKGE